MCGSLTLATDETNAQAGTTNNTSPASAARVKKAPSPSPQPDARSSIPSAWAPGSVRSHVRHCCGTVAGVLVRRSANAALAAIGDVRRPARHKMKCCLSCAVDIQWAWVRWSERAWAATTIQASWRRYAQYWQMVQHRAAARLAAGVRGALVRAWLRVLVPLRAACGGGLAARVYLRQVFGKVRQFLVYDRGTRCSHSLGSLLALYGGKTKKTKLGKKPEGCVTLFLGNMDFQVNREGLESFFEDCGAIKDVRWVKDKVTNEFKGCAFVEFWETGAVDKAIQKSSEELLGRKMRMSYQA